VVLSLVPLGKDTYLQPLTPQQGQTFQNSLCLSEFGLLSATTPTDNYHSGNLGHKPTKPVSFNKKFYELMMQPAFGHRKHLAITPAELQAGLIAQGFKPEFSTPIGVQLSRPHHKKPVFVPFGQQANIPIEPPILAQIQGTIGRQAWPLVIKDIK
jgi:hypothetical protein